MNSNEKPSFGIPSEEQTAKNPDINRVERLLNQIVDLLQKPKGQIKIEGSVHDSIIIVGDNNSVTLSKDDISSFGKLNSSTGARQPESFYLARFILSTTYVQWEHFYLPLKGTLDLDANLRLMDPTDKDLSTAGVPLTDIRHAITSFNKTRLVILGEPGSGKTTTLQRLALDLAKERLQNPENGQIPIKIDLFRFTGEQQPEEFLVDELNKSGLPYSYGEIISNGKACFLLDGLNQMPHRNRNIMIQRWSYWASQDLPHGNWAIFTSRVADYTNSLRLPEIHINKLDESQIKKYFMLHFDDDKALVQWNDFASHFHTADERFENLASNPFMLNLMIEHIKAGNSVSFSRSMLMEGLALRLIDRELQEGRQPAALDISETEARRALTEMLGHLAHQMQERGEGTAISREALEKIWMALLPDGISLSSLIRLATGASVLEEISIPNENKKQITYTFYHHLLQEYFAAKDLVRLFRQGKDISKYWRIRRTARPIISKPLKKGEALPHSPVTGWEETIIFAAALAGKEAPTLIEQIMKLNQPLAAKCLTEITSPSEEILSLSEKIRSLLLTISRNEKYRLEFRIDSGYALGELGHPELRPQPYFFDGQTVWAIVPVMQTIPDGYFLFGSEPTSHNSYPDEYSSSRKLRLPEHHLGRYPVTNAEYKLFIAHGGYNNNQWWSQAGQQWKNNPADGHKSLVDKWLYLLERKKHQDIDALGKERDWHPKTVEYWKAKILFSRDEAQKYAYQLFERPILSPAYWNSRRLATPGSPVVGVNYYEAQAYCNWLSVISGRTFRLPNEMEWEKAARGPAGFEYPWGNQFIPTNCNSLETQVYSTTPVGLYEKGSSPMGICDASGNVWEWADSIYGPYEGGQYKVDDELMELEYVLRGGSWGSNARFARCAYRGHALAVQFSQFLGFRLASA